MKIYQKYPYFKWFSILEASTIANLNDSGYKGLKNLNFTSAKLKIVIDEIRAYDNPKLTRV